MSRLTRVNQDLSGQTLNASLLPDGHARQSLIQGCDIDGAAIIGDVRGADYIGNTGAADWSQALCYASYWRGNTLTGSKFPADIGFLHHQPVAEIIRQRIIALNPSPALKTRFQAVVGHVLGAGSWDTSKTVWWDGFSESERTKMANLAQQVFAGYPNLAARFKELLKRLTTGETLWDGKFLATITLMWSDDALVSIDVTNLPPLSDPSRFTLARWAEAQADAQAPGPHHVFIYSLGPSPAGQIMRDADAWLSDLKSGF